jgi:hypothetical protein
MVGIYCRSMLGDRREDRVDVSRPRFAEGDGGAGQGSRGDGGGAGQ